MSKSAEVGIDDLDDFDISQYSDVEDIQIPTKPRNIADLPQNELRKELELRGLQPSGFWSDDSQLLQKRFDQEFIELRDRVLGRRAAIAAQQAKNAEATQLRRKYEVELIEEKDAVENDPRLRFWMDLVRNNTTPPDSVLLLTPITSRAFWKVLEFNRSMRCLDLSHSKIGDESGARLGKMLEGNTGLLKVDLEGNDLGVLSARAFGSMLAVNKTLVCLNMQSNSLTAGFTDFSGVEAFGSNLGANTTLTSLNMWRTDLGEAGGRCLAQGVRDNGSLLYVELGCNNMGVLEERAMAEALERNKAAHAQAQRVAAQERRRQRAEDEVKAKAEAEREKKQEEEEWLLAQRQRRSEERAKQAAAEEAAKEAERERRAQEEKQRAAAAERKRLEEEAKKKRRKRKGKRGKKKKKK